MKTIRNFAICIITALLLPVVSCKEGKDVASGGSRLLLSAQPSEIGFNGTSTLSVTGSDENGAPLPDGTQVTFSVAEAGTISPRTVSLLNGIARTTYFATFVEGEMTISARSGSIEANVTVTVSDTEDENVFVSANPANLPTGGGSSIISAVVTDASGNPQPDVRVQFSATEGTLQSGGGSVTTNSSGVATDTLNTTDTSTITATTDDGASGETTVLVGGRIICHMSASTTTPNVGQPVSFFDTSDVPSGQSVTFEWDFGDGSSAQGKNVQHIYTSSGTFLVVHSVTDAQGNRITCDPFTIEVSD